MPLVDQHPPCEDLQAFALGQLDDDHFAAVEEHVAACSACEGIVSRISGDTFTALLQSAQSLADTPTPLASAATAIEPKSAVGGGTCAWGTAVDETRADLPPALVNHPRYRAVRRLGSGGMGEVWLAEHRVMGRQVAVKVIRPEFVAKGRAAERFRRETQTAAMLAHPNIVTAFDAEQADDTPLLAMEYIDGVSLADELRRRGPLPIPEACDAVRQAALGLQHAHERGLVHRDVKPQNLMRAADGVVKVLDFGLAVLTDVNRDGGLTDGTVIMGTPDYIAPEQAEDARKADVRSDIYSLGCTLYHLLTGRVPFPEESLLRKLDGHRRSQPQPLKKLRPEISAALAAVVAKMTAKKPAERYQTPAEVAAALAPFAAGTVPLRKRRRLSAAVAALLLAGVVAAAGVVYRIQTDNGEVVITPGSPDVEIVLLKGGKEVEVIDTKTNKRVRIPTGTYDVIVKNKPADIEVKTDRIVVSRGNEVLVIIERVAKRPGPPQPAEKATTRNPFGVPDVEDPDGAEAQVFAAKSKLTGGADDPNAEQWVSRVTKGDKKSLDGEWYGRWRRPTTGPDWVYCKGTVQIKTVGERVYILYTDHQDTFLVDARRENGRLVGRVQGTRIRADNCPCVLLIAGPDRLDGEFGESGGLRGRQDFRRKLQQPDRPSAPPEKVGEVRRFEGHRKEIIGLSFAPDARHFLSTSHDLTVRLWDVQSDKEVRRFEGHTAWPYTAVLSPDGRRVLSGGDDLVLRIWDAQTGKELHRGAGHGRGITWIAVSPDSRRALTASWDGTIRLWNVESGEPLRVLKGHTGLVSCVVFSPDGKRALSAGADKTVRLWDLETGKELRNPEGHPAHVMSVAFSPDGRRALSGGLDKTLRLWDVDTGKLIRVLEGHTSPIYQVAFTPDGRHAFSGACPQGDEEGERGVRLWDLETGKELNRLATGAAGWLAFSPDGRHAVTHVLGHPDPRLWRLPEPPPPEKVGELHQIRWAEGQRFCSVDLSPDGRYFLASRNNPNVVRVWEMRTGRRLYDLDGYIGCFTPDGKQAITAGYSDGKFRIYNLDSGKLSREFRGKGPLYSLWMCGDGSRLVSTTEDTRSVWDVAAGKEVATYPKERGTPVLITHDGKFLLRQAAGKPPLQVLDAVSGKETTLYPQLRQVSRLVGLSANGRRLLCREGPTLQVQDVATGKGLGAFDVGEEGYGQLSGDGARLLASSPNRTEVRVWDVDSKKLLQTVPLTQPFVPGASGMGISADGRHAIIGANPDLLTVFRLPDVPVSQEKP